MIAPISLKNLKKDILNNNRVALSKAITLVESTISENRKQAHELIDSLILKAGKSIRIGISGTPGVGKSTFIENIGLYAIKKDKKVAVLAIDPSSTINKGSILGDKTRMEELSKQENAFIRPSPNSGFLGGVAISTYESILLCEAAGYNYIIIETVGVGQSETQVAAICDVFLYLTIANSGDEIQGIKRGIMEMADIIFINKIDEKIIDDNKALDTRTDLVQSIQLLPQKYVFWKTQVMAGSAIKNKGVIECYNKIEEFIELSKKNNQFVLNRKLQRKKRVENLLHHFIQEKVQLILKDDQYKTFIKKIEEEEISSFTAYEKIISKIFNS